MRWNETPCGVAELLAGLCEQGDEFDGTAQCACRFVGVAKAIPCSRARSCMGWCRVAGSTIRTSMC